MKYRLTHIEQCYNFLLVQIAISKIYNEFTLNPVLLIMGLRALNWVNNIIYFNAL